MRDFTCNSFNVTGLFLYPLWSSDVFRVYRKRPVTCNGLIFILTLSWRRPLSYRNQSIDLVCKSMGWFLYDNGLRHERVKPFFNSVLWLFCLPGNLFDFLFLVDLFRNIFIIFYCWNITLISHKRMKGSYLFLIQKQSSGDVLWGCS